ncbi:MAG: NAD-dependent epimerase/dehydratase family protein, partial [Candidatus Eisenbacteria bacterium]|nr:NAD-dependent epimerase/dehydratase family protein [Candidatus Eisenbacteria bacterium]
MGSRLPQFPRGRRTGHRHGKLSPSDPYGVRPDLPITPYGRSKLAGERALFAVEKESGRFRAIALRPPVVYGPRDSALPSALPAHQ